MIHRGSLDVVEIRPILILVIGVSFENGHPVVCTRVNGDNPWTSHSMLTSVAQGHSQRKTENARYQLSVNSIRAAWNHPYITANYGDRLLLGHVVAILKEPSWGVVGVLAPLKYLPSPAAKPRTRSLPPGSLTAYLQDRYLIDFQ